MEQPFNIDFIGIGAPKAGTTWLSKVLAAHPQICFSSIKETNFLGERNTVGRFDSFLRYNGENLSLYERFYNGCGTNKVRGEFSVQYMRDEVAATNIQSLFPDVKLIAVLREPVSRLISHYHFMRYAVSVEQRPLGALLERHERVVRDGMYGMNLGRYFERFPRKHIKVLIYEEMMAAPLETIRDVYAYLGVDTSFIPHNVIRRRVNRGRRARFPTTMRIVNQAHFVAAWLGVARFMSDGVKKGISAFLERVNFRPLDRESVSDDVRDKISRLYVEDRKKLEALLGRDLSAVWDPVDR